MSKDFLDVGEKPAIGRWIPLSFQHVFAMFGATVLVPLLTGLSPSTALFTSGTGTLLYILLTGAKVPAYLGSSFAFIPPLIAISGAYGVAYAMGGAFAVGIFYLLIGQIIRVAGTHWLDRLLPPVVIGAVIIVIGLKLAPTAMDMSLYRTAADGSQLYSLSNLAIAAVTMAIVIVSSVVLKGFFTVIPILIGIVGGYLFTLVMGSFLPSFNIIDFQAIRDASWFGLPALVMPKFSFVPVVTFLLVSLATVAEHLGDTLVLSKVAGKDFYRDPGLHRTLSGDGLATALASLFGGPPNTTYGENIGVMAMTRVYSVWVIGGAAVFAVILSFIQKFGAIISTIPTPVMGGVSTILFGIIASAGIRTVVESGVDYSCKKNLTITSVILVLGIGGGKIFFPMAEGLNFELSGLALATLVGIILNLILPKTLNVGANEETAEEMIEEDLHKHPRT
ncbi:solute carrier family 23 protein [Salinispira pacifica]|uniref:Uracil permease n=1 Tax=Salinispira pacifica TaxID=1307761 RepID=V5WNA2_9SPIO|nr:solute carrier family 23 protein [Salinispira pacifica]AHC16699.1 Uracil permease [Salinispira pacifica]